MTTITLKEAFWKIQNNEVFDMDYSSLGKIICDKENNILWEHNGEEVKASEIRNLGHIEGKIIPAEPKVLTTEELFASVHEEFTACSLSAFEIEIMKRCIEKARENYRLEMWLEFKKLYNETKSAPMVFLEAIEKLKPKD